MLLSERVNEPRLLEGDETWSFFEFDKKEKLKAKGILKDDWMDVSLKARYISFGSMQMRMPLLLSNKGYGIGVDSAKTVLFCGIPSYGQYIYTDDGRQIDYYFIYGGTTENNLELYKNLQNQ